MFSFSSVYTIYTVAIVLNFPQHQAQTLDYVELFWLKWMKFKVLFDHLTDGQKSLTAGPHFSLRPRHWHRKSFRQNRTHSRKALKPHTTTEWQTIYENPQWFILQIKNSHPFPQFEFFYFQFWFKFLLDCIHWLFFLFFFSFYKKAWFNAFLIKRFIFSGAFSTII